RLTILRQVRRSAPPASSRGRPYRPARGYPAHWPSAAQRSGCACRTTGEASPHPRCVASGSCCCRLRVRLLDSVHLRLPSGSACRHRVPLLFSVTTTACLSSLAVCTADLVLSGIVKVAMLTPPG